MSRPAWAPRGQRPDLLVGLLAGLGVLFVAASLLITPPRPGAALPRAEAASLSEAESLEGHAHADHPAPESAAAEHPAPASTPPVPPTETARPATATPPALRPIGASTIPSPTPPAPTATPVSPTATPTRPAARAAGGAGVPILMYHYVRVNPDPSDRIGYGLSVAPDLFAAHMAFLAERGYRTVPMRDLAALLAAGRVPDEKTVVLTFDDGYRDNYEQAWPVLKQHGFLATIYMISDLVDNWRYLTREHLRELDAAGVEIGSHSVSHPDLTALGPERLRRELVESRASLERIVGRPVISFCYPAGKHSPAVRAAVRAAGYSSAVTVEPGIAGARHDAAQLPRVRVYGGMGLNALARAVGEPPAEGERWRAWAQDRPAPAPR